MWRVNTDEPAEIVPIEDGTTDTELAASALGKATLGRAVPSVHGGVDGPDRLLG